MPTGAICMITAGLQAVAHLPLHRHSATMSSTQSVPAADASKAQVDAATQAMESLAVKAQGDQEEQGHNHAEDDGEGEEDDNEEAVAESSISAGVAAGGDTSAAAKKKKKKSKSKGKGKAALDKLKASLTGNGSKDVNLDDDEDEASPSSSVAGKKPTPPISDALYRRILDEAKKNLSPEEAAKLDRQAVAEMVECKKRLDIVSYKSRRLLLMNKGPVLQH
jgi:hypothetical protein